MPLFTRKHTHTHLFNGPLSRTIRVSWYQKVKPIWILLKQETVSGSGISWAICKSAPRSRQNHASTPPLSFFTGRMPFLPPNQQRQSTLYLLENIHNFSNFFIIICWTLCQFVQMKSFAKACFGEWFTRMSMTRLTRMNSCQCTLHRDISAVLDSYELTRMYSYEWIVLMCAHP